LGLAHNRHSITVWKEGQKDRKVVEEGGEEKGGRESDRRRKRTRRGEG
jgi:hypothetical protein